MRLKLMFALLLVVLAVFNHGIYAKEQIIKNGTTVLLELTPVDPRSLIQGDYMRLRYAIEDDAQVKELAVHQKRGYMVIDTDQNNVAQFVRFYDEEALEAGEKLIRFHRQYDTVRIVPDTFLFQEGHARHYAQVKYGVFKFYDKQYLLIGLADENRNTIEVPL